MITQCSSGSGAYCSARWVSDSRPRARRASAWATDEQIAHDLDGAGERHPVPRDRLDPGHEARVRRDRSRRHERHDVVAVTGGAVLLDQEGEVRDAPVETGRTDVAGVGVAEAGEHVGQLAVDGGRRVDSAAAAQQPEPLDRVDGVPGPLEREVGVELVHDDRRGVDEASPGLRPTGRRSSRARSRPPGRPAPARRPAGRAGRRRRPRRTHCGRGRRDERPGGGSPGGRCRTCQAPRP